MLATYSNLLRLLVILILTLQEKYSDKINQRKEKINVDRLNEYLF